MSTCNIRHAGATCYSEIEERRVMSAIRTRCMERITASAIDLFLYIYTVNRIYINKPAFVYKVKRGGSDKYCLKSRRLEDYKLQLELWRSSSTCHDDTE